MCANIYKEEIGRAKRYEVEATLFRHIAIKITRRLDRIIAAAARRRLSKRTQIEPNTVVFLHYQGRYGCNPAYICDGIIKKGLSWKLIYVCNSKIASSESKVIPDEVTVVKRGSYEFFKALASAKIIVDNAMVYTWDYIPKKNGQYYINTWHGSMGLKRLDTDLRPKMVKASSIARNITDYLISNSDFESDVFRNSHWPDESAKICKFGHARNDILFCDEQIRAQIKGEICSTFGLPIDTHFVLYAPTFREDNTISCYNLDFSRLVGALETKFGGKWQVISRYHFKALKEMEKMNYESNFPSYNGNIIRDIQKLMVAVDVGITDYSSWICDYVLTGKPGFIYAEDIKEYKDSRGFYYPLDSTPFPISENNDQLVSNIMNFDEFDYAAKTKEFVKARGSCEDGHATPRIINLMERLMEE